MKKLLAAVTVLAVSTAQADTIYVDVVNCPGPGDGSVGEPYCSIQDAIENAIDMDEVIVAEGTYFEAVDFLGKAVWLHSSDGPEVTIIDGTGFFHVVQCVNGEGPDTVLDGFTITGGNANGVGANARGGGMFNGGSPTVSNCTVTANSAIEGGGMINFAVAGTPSSSPTIIGCTFEGNMAEIGGGMVNFNSNPTVTNCTFRGNTSDQHGGGMLNTVSGPTVTDCTFSGNSAIIRGGAMYMGFECTPTVTNCTFSGNSAMIGRGLSFSARCCASDLTMTNCILRDGGDEISNIDGSTVTVTYTNVQGSYTGTGNIDVDPLFVDPDNGDYRLSAGSPCIDAGHNWGVPPDTADVDEDGDIRELTPLDLDGNPRFADDPATKDIGCGVPVPFAVDMGAYEFQGTAAPNSIYLGDLDADRVVGIVDFLGLLANWGPADMCVTADLDLDGNVGIIDFLLLLGNWG
jgi:hypothetical protein